MGDQNVTSTGPTGESWTAATKGHRALWAIWRALLPVAASRGEGVRIRPFPHDVDDAPPGTLLVETIYAPLWEQVRVAVDPDGTVTWCSEQSAPDVPYEGHLSDPAPWEPGARASLREAA